jgi:uncharacterized membrane protein
MSDPVPDTEEAIDRLEVQVGRLLEAGVVVSAVALAAGLLMWMIVRDSRIASGLLSGGLIALMLTPLARVVASLIAWVRIRDWFFVWTTVMVFVVLLAAWLLKS